MLIQHLLFYVQVFFCKYNDPIYVKMEKLEIMIKLASDRNIDQVIYTCGVRKTRHIGLSLPLLVYERLFRLCCPCGEQFSRFYWSSKSMPQKLM